MAIAASNRVLPLVGGMALSESLLLGGALSRRIRLAPKGCTLVSLDGDSVSIGGMHSLESKMKCYNQPVELKEGVYPNKSSIFTASDLTAGCCFDRSLLR